MNLPEDLRKYQKFVDTLSLIDRSNYQTLSERILNQILHSKDGRLVLKKRTKFNEYECYIPDLNDIPNCFVSSIWDNASIEDKIKIIDKYLDYLFQSRPSARPSLRILANPNDKIDLTCRASYNYLHNEIFINLNNLSGSTGMFIMANLFHECSHARDCDNILTRILPKILRKFTNLNEEQLKYLKLFDRKVIDLDTYGSVFDRETKSRECISTTIQDEILKCKNFFVVFNDINNELPTDIQSRNDFEKYLNTILYYYSPLERFARVSVRNYFRTQFSDRSMLSATDEKAVENIINNELYVDKFLGIFKELLVRKTSGGIQETIISMKDLFDVACRYKYYTAVDYAGIRKSDRFPIQGSDAIDTYNKVISAVYSNYLLQQKNANFIKSCALSTE